MKIVKVQPTSLASPFTSTATSFTLQAFVDSQGNAPSLSDFGLEAFVVVVLKQGDVTEMVKCSAFVVNADGSADFTVATNGRDLLPKSPYTGSSTGQDFSAGADAIVTNDPLTMSKFATLAEAQTFSALNIFSVVPQTTGGDPVNDNDLARKAYVLSLVLGTLTTIDVIVPGTAGATIAAGNLVYLDAATGKWKLADASNPATVNNVLLGIAQGTGTDTNAILNGVMLQGVDTNQSGLTLGQVEYATNTPGAISHTPGTTVVAVGMAASATTLYFDPRFDQQLTNDQLNALAGTSGTAPSSSNKYVDNSDTEGLGVIPRASLIKHGGNGADGALTVASGVTTIDLGGAKYFIKNYSSISITGTGAIAFTNAHAGGTVVIFKCSGATTISSSANPVIDLKGIGGTAGTGGAVSTDGTNGNGTWDSLYDALLHYGKKGTAASANGAASLAWVLPYLTGKLIPPGMGGGGGAGGSPSPDNGTGGVGGDGGRGGGSFILEVAGNCTISSTNAVRTDGTAGTNGGNATNPNNFNHDYSGGGGAGGGGAAGGIRISCAGTLTITGTFSYAKGVKGTGGTCPTGSSGGSVLGNGAVGGGGSGGASPSAAGSAAGAGSGNLAGGDGGDGADGFLEIIQYIGY